MSEQRTVGRESARGLLVAGDVGGTKCNLGLFRGLFQPAIGESPRVSGTAAGKAPQLVRSAHLASADFSGLAALLASFLGDDAAAVGAGCFGVPGPVVDNHARTPNLAWEIDGDGVARELGIPRVRLVNDLVATAESLSLLGSEDLAVLHPGDPEAAAGEGNRALLAAGTGLGMALLPRVGEAHVAVASEGGHMDFAPRDEGDAALLADLRRRFGHVSVERVVSGPGLANVYYHLRDRDPAAESPAVRAALAAGEDPARVVSEAALAGTCALCGRALDRFAAAYGAAAGNLALLGTATAGVYLGGGMAPKILPKLAAGGFVQAFLDKGRLRPYLEAIPVRVILNERAALFGAARLAARLA